jgi:hypothetical protein
MLGICINYLQGLALVVNQPTDKWHACQFDCDNHLELGYGHLGISALLSPIWGWFRIPVIHGSWDVGRTVRTISVYATYVVCSTAGGSGVKG